MAKYIIQANKAYTIKGYDAAMFAHEILPGLTVDDYVMNIVKRGKDWKTWNGDLLMHAQVLSLEIREFLLVMGLDLGEVLYYNPYIKVLESNWNNPIPDGLPDSETDPVYDENSPDPENPIILTPSRRKTWKEWQRGNIVPKLINGYYYVLSAYGVAPSENRLMQTLTGTELMIIYNSNDATLIDSKPEIEIE